jgi:hypothetical protein
MSKGDDIRNGYLILDWNIFPGVGENWMPCISPGKGSRK